MKQRLCKLFILFLSIILLLSSSSLGIFAQSSQSDIYPDSSRNNQVRSMGMDGKIAMILDRINESLLRGFLEALVDFSPRMTGTYGCEQAAKYIYQQFSEMGLQARYQPWIAFGNRYFPRFFRSENVEGILEGTRSVDDHIIVFNAHYDTVRRTPGADDNGGGVAAVLAAASVLSQFEFNHTLKFVAFSGEEIGLLGSHAYARESYENGDDILVDLNADMIAYTETSEGGRKYRVYGTQDVQWIMDQIGVLNAECGIDFELQPRVLNEDASRGGSDYFSFMKYGYEVVSFFEYEWNPRMHTADDSLEFINFSYLVNTTRLIVATMAFLADTDETGPQIQIESPCYGRLYLEGMKRGRVRDLETLVLDDIWIWAEIKYGTVPIDRVEFYYDDLLVFTDTEFPFKWYFNKASFGKHRIRVVAYDVLGRNTSCFRDIRFLNPLVNR